MWGPDRVRKRLRGRYSGKECKNKTKEKKKGARGPRTEPLQTVLMYVG